LLLLGRNGVGGLPKTGLAPCKDVEPQSKLWRNAEACCFGAKNVTVAAGKEPFQKHF